MSQNFVHFNFVIDFCVLFVGKPPTDDVQLCALKLKPNIKIMMMGTREENLVSITIPTTVKSRL